MQERLFRSRKDRMIAGVAGGLGEYFSVDPVIVRIAFVAATFISGFGLVAYILLWIIAPEKEEIILPGTEPLNAEAGTISASAEPVAVKRNRGTLLGIFLIFLGFLFLADNFLPFFDAGKFWPLVIVAIGVGLLVKANQNKN